MKKRVMAIAFMMTFAAMTARAEGELGQGNRTCNPIPAIAQSTPCNNFDATSVTLTQIITAICSIVP